MTSVTIFLRVAPVKLTAGAGGEHRHGKFNKMLCEHCCVNYANCKCHKVWLLCHFGKRSLVCPN